MNDFNSKSDEIYSIIKLVNEDNYAGAAKLIHSLLADKEVVLSQDDWKNLGHVLLVLGKFELAKTAYSKSFCLESLCFVQILLKELDEAQSVLAKLSESPATLWCNFLIEVFSKKQKTTNMPSFFTIRHFMEFTVFYLLLSGNQPYIDLLMNNFDKLVKINTDVEKLVGYAYLNYGDLTSAIFFLNNSLNREKFDGEIYYKLGKIYYMKGLYHDSLAMLHNAQIVLPYHYPTKALMEKVLIRLSDDKK